MILVGFLACAGTIEPLSADADADTDTDTDSDTDTDTDTDTDVGTPLETLEQATARYAALFDPTVLHAVTIDFASYHYDTLLADGTDWLPATVTIDGEILPPTGVELTGDQAAFGWDGKVDLRLDFDQYVDGLTFAGMEHLAFDDLAADPAVGREVVVSRVLLAAGLAVPRSVFATVTVQGGPPLLFTAREEIDQDAFLQRWFSASSGDLWEAGDGADFTVAGLPAWEGDGDPAALEAARVAIQSSGADFEAEVGAVLQLDTMRAVWAWQALLGNTDGWPYELDDLWIYAVPEDGSRFAFLPERSDEAFDNTLIWDGVEAEVTVRCRFDLACSALIEAELSAAADTYESFGVRAWAEEAFALTDAALLADLEGPAPGKVQAARAALLPVIEGRPAAIRAALP